ncbi:MAG: dephospho-CoA kinase [Muribaculaceae bacterium]
MKKARLIAICGGIGSGKSVVSEILRSLGYEVYDCDSRAKQIMDSDLYIHERLCAEIHPESVVDGVIDRKLISEVVFGNPEALARLNDIVHRAVKADIERWAYEHATDNAVKFVETAIPVSSGMVSMVNDIWEVTAPYNVRIERVKKRNGMSEAQIVARMKSQEVESLDSIPHQRIINSPDCAILPQIHCLLNLFLG